MMLPYFRETFAEIDLAALRHNYLRLSGLQRKPSFNCPMIKANAYGHGAVEAARALVAAGAKTLGVALVEEGVELRRAGISTPEILVFGFFSVESARACAEHRLTPVVSTYEDLQCIEVAAGSGAPMSIHLKFDTGMHRLGFATSEAAKLAVRLAQPGPLRVAGVCTHLSEGEDITDAGGKSRKQISRFDEALAAFKAYNPAVHVLNSAALMSAADQGLDLPFWGMRPGIALYGAAPIESKLELRPVMHLRSTIRMVHRLAAGDSVSYNARWTAKRPSQIAVVPLGYADGYMRVLTNRGQALVRGQKVPVVGTVCMDYIMLDVTSLSASGSVAPGESVTLWGRQGSEEISANEVAHQAGTIAYEIFTAVSARVPRVYKRDEAKLG